MTAATTTTGSAPRAHENGEGTKSEMRATLRRMQAAQRGSRPPSYEARVALLDRLEQTLLRRKDAIADAITKDFGARSRTESLLADVFITTSGIRHARANLRDWMENEPREVGWPFLPASAEIIHQPVGVVGIIAPWNYPVQLALAPLVGALAAGNRAMIKPSELVPQTAELLHDLVAETFDRGPGRGLHRRRRRGRGVRQAALRPPGLHRVDARRQARHARGEPRT